MYPRVTAIVVARAGGEHLQRTLDALRAQTRQPDVVIAVDAGGGDETAAAFAAFSPTHIVSTPERLAFGAAVATGVRVSAPPASDHEWLWLLAQDTAPESDALETLLGTVEVSPSVAVAGPKLVDWDDPARIRGLGQSMTPLGASVPLVEDELDQAQHDGLSDVLGVAPAGMIVRHALWERLGGLDPALPVVDDGLDFCVRVRLAGFRVVLVPTARVAYAGDGMVGPNRSARASNRRRLLRIRRAAQLHRRMVYAPALAVPVHWLSLVPLAIARCLGRLVRKEPGAILGELVAALGTAFGGMSIGSARRTLARNRSVGFAAIAPLRIPHAEVRRARSLKYEAALLRYRGERQELRFFSGGGVWTVLVMGVIGVALSIRLLGSPVLTGGSLLPLADSVGQLWQQLGVGFRDTGLGFVGPADPFSAVLAVLGSVTFWQPSVSLVVVWVAALPLAALGAWIAASRVTNRMGLRAAAAVLWALAPGLIVALQTGRPSAVLAHLLLPWLVFAGVCASRTWSCAATTAILAAATLACAPSLWPALVALWILMLALAGRRVARLIAIPLPALVLFAPLAWRQFDAGNGLAVFADPGTPVATAIAHPWELVIGFPDAALGGWESLLSQLSISGVAPIFVVPILLIPLGVLALLALFLRGSARAFLALGIGLLGFATAVAATHIQVASAPGAGVAIWPGAGLSLYWLGLVAAATIGLSAVPRIAALPAWVATVAVAVAVVPAIVSLPLGTSAVAGGDGRTLPAVVTADAETHPRVGTLRLTPQPDGAISAELIRGSGERLETRSTLSSTRTSLDSRAAGLARLAGNLASFSGADPSGELSRLGIDFVLLAPAAPEDGAAVTRAAADVETRASTALAADSHLAAVAATDYGRLFSVADDDDATTPAAARIPNDAGGIWRPVSLIALGVVFGVFLLLALPTGRVTEFSRPRNGDRSTRRLPKPDAAGAGAAEVGDDETGAAGAGTEEMAEVPGDASAEDTRGDAAEDTGEPASEGTGASTGEPEPAAAHAVGETGANRGD